MVRGRSQCEGSGGGMTGTLLAIGNARSVANFSHQRVCHASRRVFLSLLVPLAPFRFVPLHGIFRSKRQSSREWKRSRRTL